MADRLSYLIIGNGIAGATAAEILRAEAPASSIAVIADDPYPVYYRPALKDYLGGRVHEDKLWARPTSFYQDHNIYFLPDRVTAISTAQHAVFLQSKRQIRYERLLLASGARPARLKCPGSNLKGVTTLRTIADYQAVLQRLNAVRRVVVSGSGTLALETIETLRHRGYAVTHLLRRRILWSEVLDATASDLVLQQERRDGVDVLLEEEIAEITGNDGEVNAVVTTKGSRIPCELVIVAIGVEPNIEFIRASGIACGRGVQVDARMRTSARDVFAAGDVLETTDMMTGRTRIIGQWYPAIQQARAAAYSMLDQLEADASLQVGTFYNATFLYGLDFASVGVTNLPGYQEIIADPQPRTYRKAVLKDGIPIGMLSLGDRKQALAFKRAIDHQISLLPVASYLFASDFKLNDWLDSQGVPPVLLGVNKSGGRTTGNIVIKQPLPGASTGKQAAPVMNTVKQAITLKQAAPGNNTAKVAASGNIIARQAAIEQVKTIITGQMRALSGKADENTVVGGKPMENRAQDNQAIGAQPLTEAVLIYLDQPQGRPRLSETRLNPAKVMEIGRQPGVYMLIDEGSVSRRHAEIIYANGRYMLQDLGSTNGTFVNGTRLSQDNAHILKPNDQIRFGKVVTCIFLLRPASSEQTKRPVIGSPSMAGISKLNEMEASDERASQGQPMVNPDGSLQLSGATDSVPASIVEAFKRYPALVVLTGKKGKKRPPLVYLLRENKRFVIGRDKSNDIELADMVVSRRHAEVFPGAEGYYIRDLGSSNGVMVNQTWIDNPYLLGHGDRIAMGSTLIYFIDLQSGWRETQPVRAERGQLASERSAPAPKKQMASASTKRAPTEDTRAPQLSAPVPQIKICPRCGVANVKVARFCAGCSSPLGSS
ncbi:MAG TPA: FAD-dependent oxidoreductase [Ktedonosporobacter sp.]|jgi:NADPH-dependent 2,4-dienoyl-CoA reductase/sulfur reductase-like enzyme/pSer/pThr/pTyr-binding forkhead associated (FHA) protein|nr:FAD-dependent oxidoreductase [Ktedonosporobacter sp.]